MSHFNLVVFHGVIVISLCFQSEDDKSFLVPIKVEWIWIFSAQICWQMWVLSSGILQSLRARPRKGTAARLHIYWCHREISYTEASRGKILWALCTHFRKWVFLGGRRTYNCSQICLLRRKAGKYFQQSAKFRQAAIWAPKVRRAKDCGAEKTGREIHLFGLSLGENVAIVWAQRPVSAKIAL